MRRVTVTVLVTTYNHEAFIAQALDGILAQQTDVPFEVVVIDDASTDATQDIVRDVRDRHPDRVRLAFNAVNENSNRRFREEWECCDSEYVALLDGDDYWTSPRKLARQVAALETHRSWSICTHDVEVMPDDPAQPSSRFNGPDFRRTLGMADLWARNFIPGCSPVLRRTLRRRLPAWYDDAPWGDWPLYLLCADRGPIAYLDDVMGVYRLHAGGLWSTAAKELHLRQDIAFLEKMSTRMPHQAAAIGCELARRRRALTVELRQAPLRSPALRRWLAAGPPSPEEEQRLGALLARHTEPGAQVVRVHREPRRSWTAWEPLRLPPPPPRFAGWRAGEGSAGSVVLPWVGADHVYELSLHYPGSTGPPLARATIVGEPAGEGDGTAPLAAPATPGAGKPFVRVEPVVVQCRRGGGAATVTWSTGDGSPGILLLSVYPVTAGLTVPGEPSIAALEALRRAGAEYLLVPEAGAWWLKRDPALRRHLHRYRLVGHEPGLARLYDVRGLRRRARAAVGRARTGARRRLSRPR
jgi:hypothetical protein